MRISELTDESQALLQAMVQAPVCWLMPEWLARALNWGLEETTDRLSDLDAQGWIEVQEEEPDGVPRVMISALGAQRLGLKLAEVGLSGTVRWVGLGEPETSPPRAKHVSLGAQGADLASLPDPSPDPELAAIRGERAEAVERSLSDSSPRPRVGARGETLPTPSMLLGMGLSPWPGPGQSPDPGATCPACGSRKLRPQAYCLYCDRWGLDRLLGNAQGAPLVPLSSPPVAASPARDASATERLQAERLRLHRKAKRRRKHSASVELDRRRRDQTRGTS
ncbi:MAG: hypothetical protein AB7I30_04645 [Isosphaeraceae bacterium]